MRITVFGASGKVGQLLVGMLLEAGYDVIAFTHSSDPFGAHPQLRVLKGDVHDTAAVKQAVSGSEVVISALGSWGAPSKDIVSAGTANMIDAMQATSARRIITLTGHDARAKGDRLGILHRLSHAAIGLTPAKKILADGERHIKLLQQSNLNWTVIRSPIMNDRGSAENYLLTNRRPSPWATVNQRSVALAMLSIVQDDAFRCSAPFILRP